MELMDANLEKKLDTIDRRQDLMDQRQRDDHDLLISMAKDIKTLTGDVSDIKNDQVHIRKDVNDLTDTNNRVNPTEIQIQVNELVEWKKQFAFTWKLVVAVSSAISALVGFAISLITLSSNFFK